MKKKARGGGGGGGGGGKRGKRERENIRNMDAFSFEPFHYCSNAANVLIFRARSSRLIRPDGRFRFRGIPSISFRKCFVLFTHRRDGGGPSSCLIRSRYRPDFQCFFFSLSNLLLIHWAWFVRCVFCVVVFLPSFVFVLYRV